MTGIIFTGAIDISIGSIIVVAGTVFGILVHHGISPLACYAAYLFTAWALSMANGWLVRGLKIPAIIITLAGLAFYRGLALVVADLGIPHFSGNISVADEAYHGPGKIYAGWILLVIVAAALIWEAFARLPRRWLALGSSEEACRLLGLLPGRILQSAFCVGGIFLGAVVLGGTNIFGGEGSFAGTILGAGFLYFTSQLLVYAGVSPYFQEAATGALIVAVIGLDCALHRRRKLLEELT
jgi:ribose/xylose/arabinose/galactoside ABC-type transport system permease subunit